MSQKLKLKSEIESNFSWYKSEEKKPIKNNRVLAEVSGYLGSYAIVYWTGKRWMQANIDIPFSGKVENWCYIKTSNGYCW